MAFQRRLWQDYARVCIWDMSQQDLTNRALLVHFSDWNGNLASDGSLASRPHSAQYASGVLADEHLGIHVCALLLSQHACGSAVSLCYAGALCRCRTRLALSPR